MKQYQVKLLVTPKDDIDAKGIEGLLLKYGKLVTFNVNNTRGSAIATFTDRLVVDKLLEQRNIQLDCRCFNLYYSQRD